MDTFHECVIYGWKYSVNKGFTFWDHAESPQWITSNHRDDRHRAQIKRDSSSMQCWLYRFFLKKVNKVDPDYFSSVINGNVTL